MIGSWGLLMIGLVLCTGVTLVPWLHLLTIAQTCDVVNVTNVCIAHNT